MAGPRRGDRPDPKDSSETSDGLTRTLDPDVTSTDRSAPGRARSSAPPRWEKPDFGDRYELIETIGRGGMGDVYRAYDRELREHVALKVLREDPDDYGAALERFRRELTHARRVTHANVLRVYDIGEMGGRRFLSMQYVDGEDLAKRMRRERLGLEAALGIFRQICEGLIAAHAEGVIHRDLKPQNVILDRGGRAYIADFGIARSIGDPTMTLDGSLLGSPAYMSPEQVKGESGSAQSDIYALGVLLYQLLAGELPFKGGSGPVIMVQRLQKKPRPLRQLCPEVPAYLEKIVGRCLAVSPSERYASVRDLVADLDARQAAPSRGQKLRTRLALFLGVATLAIGVIGAVRFVPALGRAKTPPTASSRSPAVTPAASAGAGGPVPVLVLGIENRTGDPMFDGTLDVVLEYALRRSTRLDPVAGSELPALASELAPEGAPVDEHLGAMLAAKRSCRVVLVRGVVTRGAHGLSFSTSATDATTQAAILSLARDADTRDAVVGAVGEIALALRSALGEVPVDAQETRTTGLSPSLEADHDFAFGLGMVNNAGDSLAAIPSLEHAVQKDPTFAKAHYLLGVAYNNTARRDESAREFELAQKWLDQMGKRDRLQCVADGYTMGRGDFARAVPLYKEILETWPTDSFAQTNLMVALIGQRRYRESLEVGERGLEDHPRNPVMAENEAQDLVFTGYFERAAQRCQALTGRSSDPNGYECLAVADVMLSRRAEATEAFSQFERANPSSAAEDLADWALAEGRLDDAVRMLQRGLSADVAAGVAENAERKRVRLAEVLLRRGDARAALATIHRLPGRASRLFRAGLVRIGAGDDKGAKEVSSGLHHDLSPAGQALAKLFDAEILRDEGKASQALGVVRDSLGVDDAWLGHLVLGETLLDAGQPADAAKEFGACIDRRGEGVWAFSDQEALTLDYVPLATYELARAEERLGSHDARRHYEAFLAMEPEAQHDRLAADARRRLSAATR